jgi:hypothetical protein
MEMNPKLSMFAGSGDTGEPQSDLKPLAEGACKEIYGEPNKKASALLDDLARTVNSLATRYTASTKAANILKTP